MVLNPSAMMNNTMNCNSNGRCSTCTMSLVCSKSPFCSLNKTKEKDVVLEPIINAVGSGFSNINSKMNDFSNYFVALDTIVSKENSDIGQLKTSVQMLIDNINILSTEISDINSKLSKLLDSGATVNTISENIPQDINESEGIVPYSNESKETPVLVEKKGLFGKSKWVEEKKK